MRVLFVISPSFAHLYPIVPLVRAMEGAGHEVVVGAHSCFAESIAGNGLSAVSFGAPGAHEARLADDAVHPKHPDVVNHYADVLGLGPADAEHWYALYQYLLQPITDYLRMDRPELGDLVEFARSWKPDLVLWDPTIPAGAIAARVSGAAHARMLLGLDYFAWSLDKLAERGDALRAAGLSANPIADLTRPVADHYGVRLDDELMYGQWTVDPFPAGLQLPSGVERVRCQAVPFSGGGVMPEWLQEQPDKPRVAFSLGESTRRFIPGDWDRTPKLLEAVAGLDVEVVATLNAAQLTDVAALPGNVRAVDWVPLTQLMPTCSGIIHHGGIGTFTAAMATAVPQLVCDTDESVLMRVADGNGDLGTYQPGSEYGVRERDDLGEEAIPWVLPAKKLEATPCSNFIAQREAGIRLDHRAGTVAQLREQIGAVVEDPKFRAGAEALHREWQDTPSPAEIVPLLEKLTNERRG
ncbi:DUF1205 domain-containing protein [Saccharopolyspora indica]|uniref:nucleotide disphospho-sugar-binding domain-containing protein n=1 Tax=Saccharopolyspora indica TaxID=1229659 RepID=UPI0022EA14D1|nr:nucleotide disphospho-sugar-binding domain-containing protein [Saccharopolyspora indica]MDA3647019.1 DUF1205 domain-containing protein [Saccharopolyspora indica]